MFTHYLKIAFRNLTKYRMQTVISIIGLAVGFVCFALSALWIRYEMSFDNFHRNAEHLYVITSTHERAVTRTNRQTPQPLAEYLKNTFPEVRNATHVIGGNRQVSLENSNAPINANIQRVSASFMDLFDVRVLRGESISTCPNQIQSG